MTCGELSVAHGWPELDMCPKRYKDCLGWKLSDQPLSFQGKLLGDGMSLLTLEAWALYMMAHTVRREQLESFRPSLSLCQSHLGRAPATPPGRCPELSASVVIDVTESQEPGE